MGLVRPERFDVMTTPLNSQSRNAASPVGAVTNVNALQDALSRLSSGGGSGNGMTSEADFSRMVAQYRQAETSSQTKTPEPATQPQAGVKSPDAMTRNLTQRLTDQALSKARMAAQLQQRHEQAQAASSEANAAKPVTPASEQGVAQQPAEKAPKTTQGAERRAEGRDAKSSKASQGEDGDGEQADFKTTQGEGVAWVREINPPAGVDTSDPAGMMNWLAALTEGDGSAAALDADAMGLGGDGLSLSADQLAKQDAALLSGAGAPGASDGAWAMSQLGGAGHSGGELSLEGMLAVDGSEKFELAKGLLDGPANLAGRHHGLTGLGGVAGGIGESFGTRQATATLGPAPGSGQFAQAFADQVSVWVGSARADGPMTAELRLNPAEMGPINIKIAVDGQAARIDFAATALETRQAIEASLGQLSKALNEVGLSLSGGGVMSQFNQAAGQGGAAGQGPGQGNASGRGSPHDESGLSDRVEAAPVGMKSLQRGGLGGLDLYA